MLFTIDAEALHAALRGHVAPKNSMSVLSCVVVEANSAGVELRSTDHTSALHTKTAAHIVEGGAACVEYAKLVALVGSLTGHITCKVTGGQFTVSTKGRRGTFRLAAMSAQDHPRASATEWPDAPVAVPPELPRAISEVRYAVAKQDQRYFLNGVSLSKGYAFASDGHRMAISPIDSLTDLPDIIIHRDGVPSVLELLKAEGAQFCVETGEHGRGRAFHAGTDDRYLATQAIEGKVVDWLVALRGHEQIGEIAIDAVSLREAVSRCSLLAGKEGEAIGVKLTATEDGVLVQDSAGMFIDEVIPPAEDAAAWSGKPASIVLDGRYLAATLQQGRGTFFWRVGAEHCVQQFWFADSPTRHYIMPRRN